VANKLCLSFLFAVASLHAADGEISTLAKTLDGQLNGVEKEVVSLVEAMPADKFNFAPKDGAFTGVRTFGLQAMHIAAVNFQVAAAILGETNPVDMGKQENGPESIKSKDEIVDFLKRSYAYTHKALRATTQENLMAQIQNPFGKGKQVRLAALTVPQWHSFDHYGQMVVYARMCGVVPPASR
jgi:uncharacterized damage-inducible protein DinB